MPDDNDVPLSLFTVAVTAGRPPRSPGEVMNVPLTPASAFQAGGSLEYARYGNPTWIAFEEAIAELEGGQRAVSYSSGMAAISGVLDTVPYGGTVVVPSHAYFEVLQMLGGWQLSGRARVLTVDVADTATVVDAATGADLLWLESPTNPALELADIADICARLRQGASLPQIVVDNTFATPILQQPLALGADVVVHSATKYLAGHSDALLGVVVTGDGALADRLAEERGLRGSTPGVLESYLATRGLRTLGLRVERAQSNARTLAARLGAHPRVERVRYPGLGGIISIDVAGTPAQADAVCTSTRIWVHATSLGDVASLLERRRRWPGESATVPETLIRLSVGIEDVDDLWRDLDSALRSAVPAPSETAARVGDDEQ